MTPDNPAPGTQHFIAPPVLPFRSFPNKMDWWIWVLIGFALLIVEFASTTMHIGFFAAGAFLVGIAVALGWDGSLSAQLIVFTVTSLLTLLVFRPIVVRKLKLQSTDGPRVDELVGEVSVALENIDANAIGKVELRGSTWSARNVGSVPVTKGQRCAVEKVDGLLLHIRA